MTTLGEWGSTADRAELDAYLSPDQPDDDEATDCMAHDPAGERVWPCGVCSVCRAIGDEP